MEEYKVITETIVKIDIEELAENTAYNQIEYGIKFELSEHPLRFLYSNTFLKDLDKEERLKYYDKIVLRVADKIIEKYGINN